MPKPPPTSPTVTRTPSALSPGRQATSVPRRPGMPASAILTAVTALRALKPICMASSGEPSVCACMVPPAWE